MTSLKNKYLQQVYEGVVKRDPDQKEFHQAVFEVLQSFEPVIKKTPELFENGLLERLVEPERGIQFRVAWVDDKGKTQVNRGYRFQFNSAIGPYKGGLRFHPSVTASIAVSAAAWRRCSCASCGRRSSRAMRASR